MTVPNELTPERMGPLKDDHVLLNEICPVCKQKFKVGHYVAMIALESEHVPVHWNCAVKE